MERRIRIDHGHNPADVSDHWPVMAELSLPSSSPSPPPPPSTPVVTVPDDAPGSSEGCSSSDNAGSLTAAAVPGETSNFAIDVGGLSRSFLLHLPSGYSAATGPLPVIFSFHGWSGGTL